MPASRLIACLLLLLAAASALSAVAFALVIVLAYGMEFKVAIGTTPVGPFASYACALVVVAIAAFMLALAMFEAGRRRRDRQPSR